MFDIIELAEVLPELRESPKSLISKKIESFKNPYLIYMILDTHQY
jgi:hypothetical protein